ncbi:hypothetical protein NHX12_017840 [Muraenolepis orangiensis]|uniref:Uncharacterized protein n=1 Tax=Muraenolepis orangiensis TaxID=630683 RepID=A0A9Q0EYL4_9TELE|nr:hypothetical protein NHX12_017840 [Muraenolepis orangiensis]
MVDPDGTLDALADLSLTSPPMANQRTSPGAQQGPSAGLSPGAEGTSGQPYAASEMAERDPGPHTQQPGLDPASSREEPQPVVLH